MFACSIRRTALSAVALTMFCSATLQALPPKYFLDANTASIAKPGGATGGVDMPVTAPAPAAQAGGTVYGGGGSAGGVTIAERSRPLTASGPEAFAGPYGRSPGSPNPYRALLVLTSQSDPATRANLQEDLAVMYHILDKSVDQQLGQDQQFRKAMGVDLFFSPEVSRLRSAYLEGYGALFLMRVNFALIAPSTQSQASKDDQPGNSDWEEAWQEVFADARTSGVPAPGVVTEPYSEEKVKRLVSSLLESLKNAANIRGLKADEGITICIAGAPSLQAQRPVAKRSPAPRSEPTRLQGAPDGSRSTCLTIRAKKSDIDAFSKGQVNLEEFRRAASVSSYEGEAEAAFGIANRFGTGFGAFPR